MVEVANATADDDPESACGPWRRCACWSSRSSSCRSRMPAPAAGPGSGSPRARREQAGGAQEARGLRVGGGGGEAAATAAAAAAVAVRPAAGAAVQAAEREARRLGHASVGSGHVLVALAGRRHRSRRRPARLGVEEDWLRAVAVRAARRPGPARPRPGRPGHARHRPRRGAPTGRGAFGAGALDRAADGTRPSCLGREPAPEASLERAAREAEAERTWSPPSGCSWPSRSATAASAAACSPARASTRRPCVWPCSRSSLSGSAASAWPR